MNHPAIVEIVRHDPRYAYEAYEFLFEALNHTQKMLGREPPDDPEHAPGPQHHVSGPELLAGVCDLARDQFGLMARTVFRQWGINVTDDVGEIVFNLIEARLLCKTDNDRRGDFHDVFDLDKALTEGYTIRVEETPKPRRGER